MTRWRPRGHVFYRGPMRPRSVIVAIIALALPLAACGGDDSGGSVDVDGPAEAATGLPSADPDAADLPDSAQEMLDELGIDLDDLDLSDIEGLDDLDLDSMFEDLDDMMTGLAGGDGAGVITVDGVAYTVDADICYVSASEFFFDGPAVGADGSQGWASVSHSVTTREEMSEYLDDDMIEFMFPDDADVIIDFDVEVRVGATGRFDFSDDHYSWSAYGGDVIFGDALVTYEVSGNTLRGSGQAEDSNFVDSDWGDTVPIEFEVSCR